jgi:hypothetical protein
LIEVKLTLHEGDFAMFRIWRQNVSDAELYMN